MVGATALVVFAGSPANLVRNERFGRAMQSSGLKTVSPADQLRERLTYGHGRLAVLIATTGVWLMDWQLSEHLQHDQVIEPQLKAWMNAFERSSTVLFVFVTVGLLVSLYQGKRRPLFRFGLLYLSFSVLQVVANVMAMIFTAGHHQGGGLVGLWDVAAVYMETVLVFMFIYVFLDVSTPGGAFVWPSRDGEASAGAPFNRLSLHLLECEFHLWPHQRGSDLTARKADDGGAGVASHSDPCGADRPIGQFDQLRGC